MHKQLKLFLVMESFLALAAGMLGPIYAIFVREIGGGVLEAGSSWAVFMIISGIGVYFMGKIPDRAQKDKPFIIIGHVLLSLSYLGYIFVSNVYHLFAVQVVLGLSMVVTIPSYDSFYTKYLEKGKFASQWANWESTYMITQGLGALGGAALVNFYGFKALFSIMFMFSLIGLGMTLRLSDN